MRIGKSLIDILLHNRLIQRLIFLLIPLNKERSRVPHQHMYNRHSKKILRSRYMWQFDFISKEHIAHNEKINIRTMSGDDDQWT